MTTPEIANDAVFESASRLRAYDALEGLTPPEEVLVNRWIRAGSDILDLGVGTGRTVPALRSRARRYLGLDHSAAMVSTVSRRFTDVEFVRGDAADLSRFEDASFDAVVFSYNGLDYLAPAEKRARALAEIRRVLREDGVFIMSTHNPRALIRRSGGAAKDARSLGRSLAMTARAFWERGFARVTRHGAGYYRDHVQGLHTYFATPERLAEELRISDFVLVDMLGSDYPEPMRAMRTSWTYVAAMPRPNELSITIEPFQLEGSNLTKAWGQLAARTGTSPFQTQEWVSAWHAKLQPDAKVEVLVARQGKDVVGLLPIARLARPLHRRFPLPLQYVGIAGSGLGAADHVGPVTGNLAVASSLFEALHMHAASSTILLEHLDPLWSTVAVASTRGRIFRRTPCPSSTRDPDGRFDDAWTAKARKNARRRDRMMAEVGVHARWTGPGAGFPDALKDLRALHAQRWNALGQPGLFPQAREELLKEYARQATHENGPWILTLIQDGSPLAALLGFRFRDAFSVYKTGWLPQAAKLGPGLALGQEAMRWAEDRGLHTFDYLRGQGSHKAELGCMPRYDISVIRPRGIIGKLINLRETTDHPIRRVIQTISPKRRRG